MHRTLTTEELEALGQAYSVQLGAEVKELIMAAREVVAQQRMPFPSNLERLETALRPFAKPN